MIVRIAALNSLFANSNIWIITKSAFSEVFLFSDCHIFIFLHMSSKQEMATHSSFLSWRLLWMEESGGLLSMGLHRVRQD